jgi:hypothetical protein
MWQLSWMLGLLPNWFWTLILILGVLAILASWVLKFIPFVSTYRLPIQVGGILALLVGVYFQGFISNEEKWQSKIKEMESKIAEAQAQATATTRGIEVKVVEKTKVIREKGKTQIEYIDRVITQDKEVIKYIEQCPIPKAIIDEHNKAATPPEIIKELNKAAEGVKK